VPFSQIIAQDIAIHILRRTIAEEQVGHAYLFMGPDGTGKRATAMAYARALNCQDADARAAADFCGVCPSCHLISAGNHPDVRLFTPETTGGKTVIPIDAIRTKAGEGATHPLPLREDAQLKPVMGRHKVYIIDPANRPGLQEDAGNALLLTVEEPPPHVVIILVSSRPTAVLPTLISRCRPVRFHLAAQATIEAALSSVVPPEEATALAGMAEGRIGWALATAAKPDALAARRALLETVDAVLPLGRPAGLRLAETLHGLAVLNAAPEEGEEEAKGRPSPDRTARRNLPDLLDVLASWWRDLLLGELGLPALRTNRDFAAALDRQAGCLSATALRRGLQHITQTKRLIERNANIDLALECLGMGLLGA
jgi:DNA polymerase III subunit delta'